MQTRDVRAIEHEDSLIKAFILPAKQERFLYLVADAKKRAKFTAELGHFRSFNPAFATPLKWQVDPSQPLCERHLQGNRRIVELLKSKGARQTCWMISNQSSKDGREVDLDKGVEEISDGAIISCVPGRLAYFNGEDESLLLERTRN
jgi:hypothetical protein